MSAHRLILCLAAVAVVTGCAQFPDLDGTISPEMEKADYPDLVPIDRLRAMSTPDTEAGTREAEALEARAAALRARANRLRRAELAGDLADRRD